MVIDLLKEGEQLAHHCLLALNSGYYSNLRQYLEKHIKRDAKNTIKLRLAYLKLKRKECLRDGIRASAKERLRRHA